jgi:hypothetical protein
VEGGEEQEDPNGPSIRPDGALASRPSSSSATMPTLYKDARGPIVRNFSDGKDSVQGEKKDIYDERPGRTENDRQPSESMLTKTANLMDWAAPK